MIIVALLAVGCSEAQDSQGNAGASAAAPSSERLLQPTMAQQIEDAKQRFLTRLDALPQTHISGSADITRANLDEVARYYNEKLATQVDAVTSLVAAFHTDFDTAIAPIVEDARRQATIVSDIESEAVRIIVAEPRELDTGFQGIDEFSKDRVFIQTQRHRPQRLGGTLRLGPIDGTFVRSGSVAGTTALGVRTTIPKFVDIPAQVYEQLRVLEGAVRKLRDGKRQTTEALMASHVAALRAMYSDLLDRVVEIATGEGDAAARKAEATLRAPLPEVVAVLDQGLSNMKWRTGIADDLITLIAGADNLYQQEIAAVRASLHAQTKVSAQGTAWVRLA